MVLVATDPEIANIKTLEGLKPTLDQLHDGHLALITYADLAADDMPKVQKDIAQIRRTQPDIAQKIQDFLDTHKFDATKKTWGTLSDVVNNAKGLANAATSGLNPLGALFQANIWIRVGQVAIGLILIAVGVAKLTNAVPAATKIARMVA